MNKNIIINLSLDSMALAVRAFGVFAIFALLLLLSACDGDKITDGDETPASNVTMTLKSGTDPVFLENAAIYVFTSDDKFVEKKLNVNVDKVAKKLSTYMSVGTWNLVLVTCDNSITDKIILPPYGASSSSTMWKTGFTDATQKFLSQTPAELRFASLLGTTIVKNDKTETSATLNRNVAKIQVILKEYTGFDAVLPGQKNDFAFVDLLDVPTTLNWKGEYLPDRKNPYNSGTIPIREFLNFKYNKANELVADTVNFIVPAHRGSDAFEAQPKDTTTHKVQLRMSMPLKGQSYFGKTPVKLSFVPKVNCITRVVVTFRGEPNTDLDIKVTVKPWQDVNQDVEFEN